MKTKVIVFGIDKFSQLVSYYLSKEDNYEVIAFCANKEYINETRSFCGVEIISFENIEKYYCPKEYKMLITIGYSKVNKNREKIFIEAKQKGYEFINYIHPSVTISDNVELGENCIILEDCTIQPFVKISDNVIIWSGTHIGYYTLICKNVFLSAQVTIGGNVIVNNNTFIGLNSTIRDKIVIEENNVIGAGVTILKDTFRNNVFISPTVKASKVPSNRLRGI